jgi:hypothetical protein
MKEQENHYGNATLNNAILLHMPTITGMTDADLGHSIKRSVAMISLELDNCDSLCLLEQPGWELCYQHNLVQRAAPDDVPPPWFTHAKDNMEGKMYRTIYDDLKNDSIRQINSNESPCTWNSLHLSCGHSRKPSQRC